MRWCDYPALWLQVKRQALLTIDSKLWDPWFREGSTQTQFYTNRLPRNGIWAQQCSWCIDSLFKPEVPIKSELGSQKGEAQLTCISKSKAQPTHLQSASAIPESKQGCPTSAIPSTTLWKCISVTLTPAEMNSHPKRNQPTVIIYDKQETPFENGIVTHSWLRVRRPVRVYDEHFWSPGLNFQNLKGNIKEALWQRHCWK